MFRKMNFFRLLRINYGICVINYFYLMDKNKILFSELGIILKFCENWYLF